MPVEERARADESTIARIPSARVGGWLWISRFVPTSRPTAPQGGLGEQNRTGTASGAITPAPPLLPGFVAPAVGDFFLVVLSVQKGAAPEAKVSGEGPNTKVVVGRRGISFDGQRIIFDSAAEARK